MPVTIIHVKACIGNRRKGYEQKVRNFAPLLKDLQDKGYFSPGQIAARLAETRLMTPRGKPYSESVIRNMLKRGQELGLPVYVRTRSEASSAWLRGEGRRRIGYRCDL
ncbi:hypothetical protein [Blastomonas fulva]|uniref:hypothetical protein n=1 Tax=Blastomonas fulva TaxID=1550728 RepID=UPI003F6E9FE1